MSRIEPESLARLFREHGPALVLYARQWSETPEDVVQEAFLTLSTQPRVPDRVVAWLHRVVRNLALDQLRSRNRRVRRESIAAAPERWLTPPDDGLDAERAVEALRELDDDVREVIVARVWGGLTFDEIAKLVGASLSQVYRRHQAGLDELRRRLEGRCPTASRTT